jgi:ubiquinone/menaquinone biosynthesis C-methylase UbiE
MIDQPYLRDVQYRDSWNLRARMDLHERFSTHRVGWHRWVFDQFALAPQAQVLELGCGPGQLWLENSERLPGSLSLALSDQSLGMVREARDRLATAAAAASVTAVNVDAQALPFADGVFDAVVANHMLYHVPDRMKVYAEVRRVLRPDGHFYAATNGERHMCELDDLLTAAGGERRPGTRLSFRLENGADELSQSFPAVTLARYDSALVVTEAAPLIAYARSQPSTDAIDFSRLTSAIERELARDGAIRISKDTGLFTCSLAG